MPMLIAVLQMTVGFVLLMWAAGRLVAGASALARNLGVSTLVVGLTIVGFGTSAPELLVSAIASLEGNPSLAIGNALGSNIANVCLILGLTGLIYPLRVDEGSLKREFPILGVVTAGATILMLNGSLSRLDGTILLAGLFLFLGLMWFKGMRISHNDPRAEVLIAEIPRRMSTRTAVIWTLVGLAALPFSAQILVIGAVDLAVILGVSDAVIGLTIVALGTSLPELAAAVASAVKKEDDLCIGNILGSNMFNLLGVLGIAALVHPMDIERILLVRDVPVMVLTFVILTALAYLKRDISRTDGLILFGTYLVYQSFVITHSLG